MWARIENNVVMELTDIDPSGRFHPTLVWLACPEDTVEGSVYDSRTNSFTAPTTAAAVPTICTKVRGLIALFRVKKIKEPAIKKAIAAMKDEDESYALSTEFDHSQLWERDGLFGKLVALLGLTEEEADQVMLTANGVED